MATGQWKPLAQGPNKDDSILDTPSLAVTLLLKTADIEQEQEQDVQHPQQEEEDDEVQIIAQQSANFKSINSYVKESYVAALTKKSENSAILALKDYYKSSAGQMLLDIGLNQVTEYTLGSRLRKLTHQAKKSKENNVEISESLEFTKQALSRVQLLNKPFKATRKHKCRHCRFSTEFQTVLDAHLEVPHQHKKDYLCNWCEFKNKSPDQTIAHYLHHHKRRCRIEMPILVHLCRNCPFETNSKRSIVQHTTRCEALFSPNQNLGPQEYGENDYPGVTSRLITQEDIKAYERAKNALLLSSYNPHQVSLSRPDGKQQKIIVIPSKYQPNNSTVVVHQQPKQEENASVSKTVCNPLQQFASLQHQNKRHKKSHGTRDQSKLQSIVSAHQNQLTALHPSILQYPRQPSLFANGRTVLATASGVIMAPTQQEKSTQIRMISNNGKGPRTYSRQQTLSNGEVTIDDIPGGNRAAKKSNFIICEICDYYIKDVSDLTFHMESIHDLNVKLKSSEHKPPLSCLKCKWRFFTDQGLERHLLGVHNLITSNVQSQVDQGKDSGRCTVCGKAFASKLVQHVKEVHKANLKPTHLSYRCPICTASFNLYSHFENHIASIHTKPAPRASVSKTIDTV